MSGACAVILPAEWDKKSSVRCKHRHIAVRQSFPTAGTGQEATQHPRGFQRTPMSTRAIDD